MIYLAGPMTGLPEFNYPEFNRVATLLRLAGYDEVLNPAEHFDGRTDLARETYLRAAVEAVCRCDQIVFLPGWEESRGAQLEHTVAVALGLQLLRFCEIGKMWWVEPLTTISFPALEPETVCQEADRIVSSDRQSDYGHPFHDFTRTGKMWGAILGTDAVTPRQVAMMMVALKLSRECNKHKRDNIVDGIGYLKTLDLVVEREETNGLL